MKKTLQLVLVFVSVFYSCEKEIDTYDDESLSNEKIIVDNGMLIFKDINAFTKQLEILHSMSEVEQESWLLEIGFSNSLYQKTKDLTVEEILEEKYVEVPDRVFSKILNSEGVYVVGNEAHKILQEKELTIAKKELKKKTINWSSNATLKEYPVYYGDNDYLKKQALIVQNREDLQKTEPYDGDFIRGDGSRANLGVNHLSAHLIGWNRGYVAYASVGVKIKGRKKKRRKWKNDEMWFAAIDYEAWVQTDFADRHTYGFLGEANKKSVEKVLFWKTGGRYLGARIEATFSYEDDGYPRVVSDRRLFRP